MHNSLFENPSFIPILIENYSFFSNLRNYRENNIWAVILKFCMNT